jgi:hypothetical protein
MHDTIKAFCFCHLLSDKSGDIYFHRIAFKNLWHGGETVVPAEVDPELFVVIGFTFAHGTEISQQTNSFHNSMS